MEENNEMLEPVQENEQAKEDPHSEPKWYVIHTYSSYEFMVQETLKKLIENNNLSNIIVDIKIPTQDEIEEKNGKKKLVTKKSIPGYVFIKMNYTNDLWFLITNIRGVTGFVGPQGRATPITDLEVRKMRLEDKLSSCDFAEGDNVKIISGNFVNYPGKITRLDKEKQKASVKVVTLGRELEIEMDFIELEKINLAEDSNSLISSEE